MQGPDSFRVARAEDHAAIDTLLCAAFRGPDEAKLVHDLRSAGTMETELVMPWQGGVAAYLAMSSLIAPAGWLALAPVAVAPDWQGRGLGLRLVAGVMRLMALRGATVVVVGRPSFYARAGFSLVRAQALQSPYPPEVTLLSRPGEDQPQAQLVYPPAFDGV